MTLDVKQMLDEVDRLFILNLKEVNFYQLGHEVSPLLWRNLKSVDSQRKQNFGQLILWLSFIIKSVHQFIFMVSEHLFRNEQVRL